ncbi:MAG: Uma2 family endonuclease [Hyphomicrobiaceae bacterium]
MTVAGQQLKSFAAKLSALQRNDCGWRQELIFDHVMSLPQPPPAVANAAGELIDRLTAPHRKFWHTGPSPWLFAGDREIQFGPHVLVPHISAWERGRLQHVPATYTITAVPDFVCEVIEPASRLLVKRYKRQIYATCGVRCYWEIDVDSRYLEVFRLFENHWLLTHTFFDCDDVCAPPFEAITFSLGLLWPFDPPSVPSTEPTS